MCELLSNIWKVFLFFKNEKNRSITEFNLRSTIAKHSSFHRFSYTAVEVNLCTTSHSLKLKYNAHTVFLPVRGTVKFERGKNPYSIVIVLREQKGKAGRSRLCERANRMITTFSDQT